MNMPPPEMFAAQSRRNSAMSERWNWTSMLRGTRSCWRRSRILTPRGRADGEAVSYWVRLTAYGLTELLGSVVPDGRRQLKLLEAVAREPVAGGCDQRAPDAFAAGPAGDGDLRDEADVAHPVDRRVAR